MSETHPENGMPNGSKQQSSGNQSENVLECLGWNILVRLLSSSLFRRRRHSAPLLPMTPDQFRTRVKARTHLYVTTVCGAGVWSVPIWIALYIARLAWLGSLTGGWFVAMLWGIALVPVPFIIVVLALGLLFEGAKEIPPGELIIERNAPLLPDQQTLLRASDTPPENQAQLLRAAQEQETPAEQLLRSSLEA